MERAYYVVADDSDKDDDVTNSCDSARTDDVIKRHTAHNTVSFRLLRAYRTDKRRRRPADKTRYQNTSFAAVPIAGAIASLPVPVANSHDVGPEVQLEKTEVNVHVDAAEVGPSRTEICVSFCKRFVAFLLSTLGLSILTAV